MARSRARSCPARGRGCCRGVTHTKPPLCPRGERRRPRRLLPGQRENKPQGSPEAGNSSFGISHSAARMWPQDKINGCSFPSTLSRCLPVKLLPAKLLPAGPEQPHTSITAPVPVTVPCTGMGHPGGTRRYQGGTRSSASSSAEPWEVKETEFGHRSPNTFAPAAGAVLAGPRCFCFALPNGMITWISDVEAREKTKTGACF